MTYTGPVCIRFPSLTWHLGTDFRAKHGQEQHPRFHACWQLMDPSTGLAIYFVDFVDGIPEREGATPLYQSTKVALRDEVTHLERTRLAIPPATR